MLDNTLLGIRRDTTQDNSEVIPNSKQKEKQNKLLDSFLRYTERQYGSICLFDQSQPSASIFDVFVPTPTNFVLNVEVKNCNITSIEEERHPSEDVARFQHQKKFKYSIEQVNCFREKLEQNIRVGKEYKYPDTRLRPLIISAPQADGIKSEYWSLNVFDVVSLYNKIVLLGKPGTGKSTALRYLTINLIRNYFGDNCDDSLEKLSNELFEKHYIPIYIEFRKLTEWWVREKKVSNISATLLKEYLLSIVRDSDTNCFELDVDKNYIFIFDGIDEICSPNAPYIKTAFGKQALNNLVILLNRKFRTSKFIFASRIGEYAEWQLNGFEIAELIYMNDFLSIKLIKNICNVLGNPNKDTPERLISDMRSKGFGDDIICNPMLLSLITSVALKNTNDGVLPNNKTEILQEGVNLLLNRWAIKGTQKPVFFTEFEQDSTKRDMIFEQLEEFAFNQNENGSIDTEALLKFCRYESNSAEILDYLSKQVGLIIDEGNNHFKFAHKSFRSYLAASFIVRQPNQLSLILKDIEQKLVNTHETTFLAIDLLFDRNDNIYVLSSIIMELLSGDNLNSDWCVWFASKILYNRGCLLYNTLVQKKNPFLPILKDALLRCFVNKNELPLDKRIECGKLLGYFGDIRMGTSIKNGIPEISWFHVDGGEFTFGIDDKNIKKISETEWGKIDFSREQTSSGQTVQLSISPLEISKYPITVSQFESFLKARDGYFNEKWFSWSELALQHYKQKCIDRTNGIGNFHGFYLPEEMQVPNYPITNVTFYDAVAFCKWFGFRTGEVIRLPSEMEVEYVEKLSGNSIFLWSDDFSSEHWSDDFVTTNCNYIGTKIGHVCSVGAFDNNENDFPVDLIGNTWEWTQSYFSDTLDSIADNMIINVSKNKFINTYANSALISVRGGSIHNGINGMRISFRGRDPIRSVAKDRHSFRIVRINKEYAVNYDESIFLKQSPTEKITEGYGVPIKRGDKITVLYYILNETTNKYVQEQADFSFILGEGMIHKIIEDELLSGHRVACNIRLSLLGRDLFGENGFFDRIHPNDKLSVLVHIKDIFETE